MQCLHLQSWPWRWRHRIPPHVSTYIAVDCIWNVMAHTQKPDFVFRWNGRVHLNRQGRQFSRLLVAELCASAVVMPDTPWFEVVWRVLATHSIHQFPLHFHPPFVHHCVPSLFNWTLQHNIPLDHKQFFLFSSFPPDFLLKQYSLLFEVCWYLSFGRE